MPICEDCKAEMLNAEMLLNIKKLLDRIENNVNKVFLIKPFNDMDEETLGLLKYLINTKLWKIKDDIKEISTVSQYRRYFNEYGSYNLEYDFNTVEKLINKLS